MRHLQKITLLLTSTALFACGTPNESSTIRGKTSDDLGAQKQGLGSENLGGSGSAAATAKVQVAQLEGNGALTALATTDVKAGGAYELQLKSPGAKKLIVQALDAAGAVRASVIVESSGESGDIITASPMDTETSVEAEVLAQMVSSGVSVAQANAIDLRARINAKTAEAVKASTGSAARVKALAEAVASAQRAQLKAYAEAGVTVTQEELFDAQLSAATALNVALDAAADKAAAEQAYAAFLSELEAKTREKAGDAKKASRGERAASVAFRATLKARVSASGSTPDPVVDAAVRQAAALEARTSTAAADTAMTTASAAQTHVNALKNAGAVLRQSLGSSASISASAQAYASYSATLVGSGDVSATVLGNYLELNGATASTVQPAVNASVTAATQLDTALNSAVTTSITASNAIDFDAFATSIVAALKTFDTAVQAQSPNLVGFGSKADVALELMIQANGSLRIAE